MSYIIPQPKQLAHCRLPSIHSLELSVPMPALLQGSKPELRHHQQHQYQPHPYMAHHYNAHPPQRPQAVSPGKTELENYTQRPQVPQFHFVAQQQLEYYQPAQTQFAPFVSPILSPPFQKPVDSLSTLCAVASTRTRLSSFNTASPQAQPTTTNATLSLAHNGAASPTFAAGSVVVTTPPPAAMPVMVGKSLAHDVEEGSVTSGSEHSQDENEPAETKFAVKQDDGSANAKTAWKPRKKRQCPECNLYFSNLATHKSTHLKPTSRPHVCEYCNRGFARPNDLFRHVKCHWKETGSDKGQFKCPFKSNQSGDHCCHSTGIFSRCDTFKNHLKAIHFQYPTGTRKDQRNKVGGTCRACYEHFNNVDEWVTEHIEKNLCKFAGEYNKNQIKLE